MSFAAYVRVSTGEQAEGTGLDTQKQKIREWARLHDIGNIDLYEDPGISGGTMDRDGLQRLLSDVEDGDIETVVVYKADRLSRSLRDLLTALDGTLEPRGPLCLRDRAVRHLHRQRAALPSDARLLLRVRTERHH